MVLDIFAATIINFCGLKNPDDLQDGATRACTNFILNCVVDKQGQVSAQSVEDCKVAWNYNKERIIEKSLKD